jgi:hypothetical protein
MSSNEVKAVGCDGIRPSHGVHTPCGKIPAPGSKLCPKCIAVTEYHAGAQERRAEKARKTREARNAKAAFLATSPLRANNPEYGKPRQRWVGGHDDIERAYNSESANR